MERESFEDDATARFLNEHFISIKVDREQRPDLDALMVEEVSRLGQSPGWPLTLILTPDLEPIFGGTYLPKVSSKGRPGLVDVLREVDERWREDPAITQSAKDLVAKMKADALAKSPGGDVDEPLLKTSMALLERARDRDEGGFGTRQKFPNSPLLLAELRWAERTGDVVVLSHVVSTLEHLGRGGIRDHLAGSFHRYAVDRRWHIPHFEKTLYDNAQLASIYLEASRLVAGEQRASFLRLGRAILDDLAANWQRPDGGMIVGFDADDPQGEGAYYTFTRPELDQLLGPSDARIFATLFGVTAAGERSLEGRSVLHRREDAAVAKELSLDLKELDAVEARSLPKLLAARASRPPPRVDDKELAGWNGLALMAFADAARSLDEPRYLAVAQRIAKFLVAHCWDAGSRSMRRGLRAGSSLGDGFLEDHALPALGLLRLHAADGDPAWLLRAHELDASITARFHDAARDAFFHAPASRGPGDLPMRLRDGDDGVLPSGASAASLLFLELGELAGDQARYDVGARALRAVGPRLREDPFASGFALVAADHMTRKVLEVVIAGDPSDPTTLALARELSLATDARILPIRVPSAGASPALLAAFPGLAAKTARGGRAAAYVCTFGACDAPTSEAGALRQQLTNK